ncbi:MAG: laccase domain-containing protein, partial [Magnetococcales bacterium]|nr:laccase domain-containing protein [Magnetococcales bacterium]
MDTIQQSTTPQGLLSIPSTISNIDLILTTREGGVSVGPYASLNLGDHVSDDLQAVQTNRRIVAYLLNTET